MLIGLNILVQWAALLLSVQDVPAKILALRMTTLIFLSPTMHVPKYYPKCSYTSTSFPSRYSLVTLSFDTIIVNYGHHEINVCSLCLTVPWNNLRLVFQGVNCCSKVSTHQRKLLPPSSRNKIEVIVDPSWEANSSSASWEILCILWDLKGHHHVHTSLPVFSILNHINPTHTLPFYLLIKIYFNIILPQCTEVMSEQYLGLDKCFCSCPLWYTIQ